MIYDAELQERIALALRVLFPGEAWDTYIRSAACVIHEINRTPFTVPK